MTVDKTPGQNLTFWKMVQSDPTHPMRKKIQVGTPQDQENYIQKMINKIDLEIELEKNI